MTRNMWFSLRPNTNVLDDGLLTVIRVVDGATTGCDVIAVDGADVKPP